MGCGSSYRHSWQLVCSWRDHAPSQIWQLRIVLHRSCLLNSLLVTLGTWHILEEVRSSKTFSPHCLSQYVDACPCQLMPIWSTDLNVKFEHDGHLTTLEKGNLQIWVFSLEKKTNWFMFSSNFTQNQDRCFCFICCVSMNFVSVRGHLCQLYRH